MRGNLPEAVAEVGRLCNELAYFSWGLRGNPFLLQYPPETSSAHFSILQQQISDLHDIHLDSVIGTMHIFQLSPDRIRLAARAELLDGRPLHRETDSRLRRFCDKLDRQLAIRGLKVESGDLSSDLQVTAPLSPSDTGPLHP